MGTITLNCLPRGFVAKLRFRVATVSNIYRGLVLDAEQTLFVTSGRDAKINFLRSFKGIGPS
jgi:hypothetical protein